MRHKESAIAVMIAAMLGAASLLGGFSSIPALATHDPDAELVASKTISQADTESIIVDTVELTAKKVTHSTAGTVTLAIVQDGEILESDDFTTSSLTTTYRDLEVTFGGLNVTGSFEILVEFDGDGIVSANNIQVIEGTEVAETGSDETEDEGSGSDDVTENDTSQPEPDFGDVIASKTLSANTGETMTIDTVEFIAKKVTYSTAGTVTLAIVQDGEILDANSFKTSSLTTTYRDFQTDFGGLEVLGDFQVVIMFDGDGIVSANSITIAGATETAGDPEPEPDPAPNPDGTFLLTINAVAGDGSAVNGMWIEVYEGVMPDGSPEFIGFTPKGFELAAGNYVVAVADHDTNIFQSWNDGETDRTRPVSLQQDTTLTAIYSTDGTQPTPNPDPEPDPAPDPSPPPSGGSGTITVYAYRIPSEFWGPTFTGANAQMWVTIHNSSGYAILGHGTDENGYTFTGLNDGEEYMVVAHDCDECHNDPHDVVFDHWENGSTEKVRFATTGVTVSAYYAFDPDP